MTNQTRRAWCDHKAGFTAAALVILVTILGAGVSLWLAVEASRAREVAASARHLAEVEHAGHKHLLREAARSDRLLAMELFNEGRDEDGFAHLARACDYDPESTLAAEIAIFRLNLVNVARQVSILRGDNEFPLVRIGREERYRRIEHGEDLQMSAADFTPDGQQVVTLRDYAPADFAERNRGGGPTAAAELWDVSSGWKLQRKLVEGRVCGAPEEFQSPSDKPPGIQIFGTFLAYDTNVKRLPSPDGSAEVVLENEAVVLRPKAETSDSIPVAKVETYSSLVARFASDGLRVASAGDGPEDDAEYDYRVMLHSVPAGQAMGNCMGHAQRVTSVRFSPDCAQLVTASDDTTARVWETADRRLSDRFGWDQGMLFTVKFSPDGSRIIANGVSGEERLDGLLIWDALTGELLHDSFLREDALLVGSSASGTLAILREGSWEGSGVARVWDVVNDREVARLGDRALAANDAQFSPDDRVVAIREQDGSIRIWDTKDGHQISEVARATREGPTLCFSPDSRHLLVDPKQNDGDERPVVMVEVASGKVLFEMPLGNYGVGTASFHPEGTLVATGSNDGIARVWECPSGRLVATLPQTQTVTSAEFSPDGAMLAIACFRSHVVEVWNVANWQLIRRIQCSMNQEMGTVNFSPDSHLLAGGGGRERVLNIWEARSGQAVASIEIPHAESRDFDFSPDGKRLVIPSRNSGEIPESGGPIVLEVPALSAPVPNWFADFLRFLPQRKIDDDGHMRVLTPLEWESLRDRVAAAADADRSRYGELARWFLASADQRPVRPGSSMTRHELADRLVTPQAGAVQLARALAFDPANPLAHLAIARFASSDEAQRHLRSWAHQHLPANPSRELQVRIDAIEALPAIPREPANE